MRVTAALSRLQGVNREMEGKGGAHVQLTLDRDPAAVELYDPFGDGKSQTGTLRLVVLALSCPVEPLENMG